MSKKKRDRDRYAEGAPERYAAPAVDPEDLDAEGDIVLSEQQPAEPETKADADDEQDVVVSGFMGARVKRPKTGKP